MLISWNWLKQYVALDMPVAELERRLMMAGLNHESTEDVEGDICVDLEVTSNRPDCLGHIGIAREVAVLWGRELKLPPAQPAHGKKKVNELTQVAVECPALCPRYTARVIQGVKVGPSPAWLSRRLKTVGIAAINNVVDVTNYVLMECGQPLHAFDLARLRGRRIIVRDARPGEKFLAINHKTYELSPGICVIADAEQAIGLGGVMGGADSEVTEQSVDLLIESAEFAPQAIRSAARKLNLHSDSSYRFERGIDPQGIDWASRRCCELILETAGGELAAGVIDIGQQPGPRQPVTLRLGQIKRVLGISIDQHEVRRILAALGNDELRHDEQTVEVIPPSHRRDLAREIDLVEEVARIHGYENIPEDVSVPMAPSSRTAEDRVLGKIRHVLTALGYDEAMTLSLVDEAWSDSFSPWTDAPPLRANTAILGTSDRLRRSLLPSLLGARRNNEKHNNPTIELFEAARVYLPQGKKLPREEVLLSLTSGGDFYHLKGTLETVLAELDPGAAFEVRPLADPLFAAGRAVWLCLNGEKIGCVGQLSTPGRQRFDLRGPATAAEIQLAPLVRAARLTPIHAPLSPYPPVARDLNMVFDESVRWDAVAANVRASAGPMLESLAYQETYRSEQLGPGKKSLLFGVTFRGQSGTLTGEEVDGLRDKIVGQLAALGGTLRA
ncbi:MAG: phenylalanine--tRNA ligase subunit beta [Pirellulales bacterium]